MLKKINRDGRLYSLKEDVPETMICSQKYSGSRCLFPKSQSRDSILTWYFSPFSVRYMITGRAAA